MKRAISLGLLALALGSCQSEDAGTQSLDSASSQVGVLARLEAKSALPAAERIRARLTIGATSGTWSDSAYLKGRVLHLGQVPRGSFVTLDVRAYTVRGTDTIWKWFAHRSDSVAKDLQWIVLEAEIDTLPALGSLSVQAGQSLLLPPGTWYTTDTTRSWSAVVPSVVGPSGSILPTAGTTLRIRLRQAVPGTRDTLPGDTARFALPAEAVAVAPPVYQPTSGALAIGSSIRIEPAQVGDEVQFRIQGAVAWTRYTAPIPAAAVTLEARSVRGADASPVVVATFSLATVLDTIVDPPRFSPVSGSILAAGDSIRIEAVRSVDTVEIRRNGGTAWTDASALPATTDTIHARSRRGKFLSAEVVGIFSIRAGQPSMPTIALVQECAADGCDPGIEVRISHDSGALEVATDTAVGTADWKTFRSGDVLGLSATTTVFARTTRSGSTSATASTRVVVAQPVPVRIDSLDRGPDSVRVRLSTTSGSIRYRLASQAAATTATNPVVVMVPVGDSLRAWSVRGTRSSAETGFQARGEKPRKPAIVVSTTSGPLAPDEIVRLVPATPGDALQYRLGGSGTWLDYTAELRSGTSGSFTIAARALRHGLASDDTTRTFAVDTAKLAPPILVPACDPSCDPGAVLVLKAAPGTSLGHGALADSGAWKVSGDTMATFVVGKDTTVFARGRSATKASAIVRFDIVVRQPGAASLEEVSRTPDSVRVRILVPAGDTVLYARDGAATFTNSGRTDSLTLSVRVFGVLRFRTKRGTAQGPVSDYTAEPGIPERPAVLPAGGHIRDTTRIRLTGTAGDTLSYRVGSTNPWIRFTAPFSLPVGTSVLRVRSTRHGRNAEDSATFVVHARPDTVRPIGCLRGCSPGTTLQLSATAGSDAQWTSDTSSGEWTTYAGTPLRFATSTTLWVRADSAGYRSRTTRVGIEILQPDHPVLAGIRTKRPALASATDTAFVTITSAQDGDSLAVRVGAGPVVTSLVVDSASVVQPVLVGQTLVAWTSRGGVKSDSVQYTFKSLPAPVAQTPAGTYNRGKAFAFALAGIGAGSESGDVILLSTVPGSWTRTTTITPTRIGTDTVYARAVRMNFLGEPTDSSAIRKVVYTIDTTLITALSTTPGTFARTFDPAILSYVDSVDAGVSSLEVSYTARAGSDIRSVLYNNATSSTIALTNAPQQTVSVRFADAFGTVTTYSILVCKRASDSALASLSTTPGSLPVPFSPGTTTYVDSVPHDASSVVVNATPRTPGDVVSITYNAGELNTVALNAQGVTTILVKVTNRNGRFLTYTLQVHKKGFPYGSLTWGGKTYKTTVIGTQTWMSENLDYGGPLGTTGVCQGTGGTSVPGPESACTQYGRLYTWFEAAGGTTGSSNTPSGLQGICPDGWHLPSNGEWATLVDHVESDPRVGVDKGSAPLRSKTSWVYLAGTDLFGFTAGLSGSRAAGGTFNNPDQPEYWASDKSPTTASTWHFFNETIGKSGFYPEVSLPVRCVKD